MNRVAREEGSDTPKLMQQVILLLLYANAVIFYSMQRLLGALEAFFQSSGLTVNVDKTKLILVRNIQPHQYPMLTYKGEHEEFVQSFKYLGINVPTTNKWNVWFESRLQASRKNVIICWKINATRFILMDRK